MDKKLIRSNSNKFKSSNNNKKTLKNQQKKYKTTNNLYKEVRNKTKIKIIKKNNKKINKIKNLH